MTLNPIDYFCKYARHALHAATHPDGCGCKSYLTAGGQIMHNLTRDAGEEEDWPDSVKKYREPLETITKADLEDADTEREGEPLSPAARLMREIRRIFLETQRAAAEALGGKKAGPSEADIQRAVDAMKGMNEKLYAAFMKELPTIFGAGQVAGADLMGIGFDVTDPNVLASAQKISEELAQALSEQISRTTANIVEAQLSQAIQRGESIGQMAARIQNETNYAFSTSRAETIARTESARAFEEGTEQTWEELGAEDKRFQLAANACPQCQAFAAKVGDKVYPIGEPFLPDGEPLANGTTVSNFGGRSVPIHPNCVMPDTVIRSVQPMALMRSWYEGKSYEILTAKGVRLTVTANHQFLTREGFTPAHSLSKGDDLFNTAACDGLLASDPDTHDMESTIEQRFNAAAMSGGMASASVPVSPEYLHGDGRFMDGDIDIVFINGELWGDLESRANQHLTDESFAAANVVSVANLVSLSDFTSMFVALGLTAHSIVSGSSERLAVIGAGSGHAMKHSLGSGTGGDAAPVQVVCNGLAANAGQFTKTLDAVVSSGVEVDEIVDIRVRDFAGHVYDLQSLGGINSCNSIITSNCRCASIPVV